MPATINESDIPAVVDLLSRFAALNPATIPSDLSADEVALISRHRRQRIVDALENKGIVIRAAPVVRELTGEGIAIPAGPAPVPVDQASAYFAALDKLPRMWTAITGDWIDWHGGEGTPVLGRVEYILDNGIRDTAPADQLVWSHSPMHPNIVRYRAAIGTTLEPSDKL